MVNEKLTFIKISKHERVEVVYCKEKQQHAIFSLNHIGQNEVITSFSTKELFSTPSYLTIQIDNKKHISLSPEYLQYTNHSCSPNVFFNTIDFNLVAIKDIQAGEELCFFYPSTEFEMAQPFDCLCGAPNCLKKIEGAKYLSINILKKHRVSAFINAQLFL
jgi:hypothetical protein